MITIPSEVKAALKDGGYSKNFRFDILRDTEVRNIETVATLTAQNNSYTTTDNGVTYCIYAPNIDKAFDYYDLVATMGGGTTRKFCPYGNGETFIALNIGADIRIDLHGFHTDEIIIGKVTYVTEKTVVDTIDNSNLVADSVKITERMATGDLLKFGLCEGSNLELEYFDKQNVKDCDLRAYIDIYYGAEQPYTIPMGTYTVDEISRQASTGIKKVTAYNKLQSKYLDKKANNLVRPYYTNDNVMVSMYDIKHLMLKDYTIELYEETAAPRGEYNHGAQFDDGSSTKFKTYYGDKGFNSYSIHNLGTASSPATFKLYIDVSSVEFELDPTKYYRIDGALDLNEYEQAFYDYMYNLIDNAGMNVTASAYMTSLIKNSTGTLPDNVKQGWGRIFAIELIKEDDTREFYSLVMKNNGVAVAGTMSDLCHTLITGYKRFMLWMPNKMGEWSGSGNSYSTNKLFDFYGDDFNYVYYTDASNAGYSTFHKFRHPDGSKITEQLAYEYRDKYLNIVAVENVSNADLIKAKVGDLPDFTLREIVSAVYEMNCQLGKLDRETDLFSGVELSQNSAVETVSKDMYSDLWYDKDNEQSWKYLIITYKGLDGNGNEAEYTLQRTINANGTQNYNCSGNWIFRNLIWTAEQVGAFADAMVAKMQGVTWFPFEMWCAGLPYLETGDKITIPVEEDDGTVTSHDTYILQRELGGIQDLHDTYINGTLDIF